MASDWSKLTVVDLRAELKRRGLAQAGKKADLIERLASADEQEAETDPVEEEPPGGEAPAPAAAVLESASEPEPNDQTNPKDSRQPSQEIVQAQEAIPSPIPSATAPPNPATITPTSSTPKATTTLANTAISPQQPVPSNVEDAQKEHNHTDAMPAPSEVANDVQTRKRRSRSPSASAEEHVRKRVRPDDTDTDMAEADGHGHINGLASENQTTLPLDEERPDAREQASSATVKPAEAIDMQQSSHLDEHPKSAMGESQANATQDIADQSRPTNDLSPPADDNNISNEHPASYSAKDEEAAVVPAIHPATSALYIKNFMRPLRSAMVEEHLVQLATAPGNSPDPSVIVDFFLDQIRTHAYVNFNSISAASRVRSILHDTVWPDERNRKALWVDFIPPEQAREWAAKEQEGSDGRGNLNRWEVIYEPDDEGNLVARLEEVGPDTARQTARPPPAPVAASSIPTGPSRSNIGIEGAPLGPRGAGGRMGTHRAQAPVNAGEGWKGTRASPSILYKVAPEELARRRVENMRSFYSLERNRDMGRQDEINRYTFEDEDSFVDRGKEFFVGIRPPHREHDRHRGGGFAGGPPRGPPRGPRGPPRGPPPGSGAPFRPRNDRAFGGGGSGSGWRSDDLAPRSRLDGAPLPTYNGPSDRRGRDDYRSYRH